MSIPQIIKSFTILHWDCYFMATHVSFMWHPSPHANRMQIFQVDISQTNKTFRINKYTQNAFNMEIISLLIYKRNANKQMGDKTYEWWSEKDTFEHGILWGHTTTWGYSYHTNHLKCITEASMNERQVFCRP